MHEELTLVWEELESAMRSPNGHRERERITYCRLRVPSGWLVRVAGYSPTAPITDVPDLEHTWLVEEPMPAS